MTFECFVRVIILVSSYCSTTCNTIFNGQIIKKYLGFIWKINKNDTIKVWIKHLIVKTFLQGNICSARIIFHLDRLWHLHWFLYFFVCYGPTLLIVFSFRKKWYHSTSQIKKTTWWISHHSFWLVQWDYEWFLCLFPRSKQSE